MSELIQLGTPPGNPLGLPQKTCPGSGFGFSKLPGDWEFNKYWDFVENDSETSKKDSVHQIFRCENKKS